MQKLILLLGKMEALGVDVRSEAHIGTLTEDVVKTSKSRAKRYRVSRSGHPLRGDWIWSLAGSLPPIGMSKAWST